jgi:putative phage-type endonuclease
LIAELCVQGTDEWRAARVGLITASRIRDVLAKVKSGEAATRRNYKAQLVVERLTGKPYGDDYTNAAMRWGVEQEPFARAAYEMQRGLLVDQVGLVLHPIIEMSGASPDGLVGADGLVEIKCPKTANHLDWLLADVPPAEYEPQMQWQMACTGRAWCDFVSYEPNLPEHLQLFVVRAARDETWIKEMQEEVVAFDNEILEMLERLALKAEAVNV